MAASRPPPPYVRRGRWWNAPWFDTLQFIVFTGALLWLTVTGAMNMGYNWQWYRVPRFIWRVVDGELIWGPLIKGLVVTLEITAWSVVLTLAIGLVTALLRLSNSFSGRIVAKVYLEAVRNTPLLIQIYLFYFVLGPIIGLDRFWVGVACLSVFEGAFAMRGDPGRDPVGPPRPVGGQRQHRARPRAGLPLRHPPAGGPPDAPAPDRARHLAHQELGHRQRHRRVRPDHRGTQHHRGHVPELRDLDDGRRHLPGADRSPCRCS